MQTSAQALTTFSSPRQSGKATLKNTVSTSILEMHQYLSQAAHVHVKKDRLYVRDTRLGRTDRVTVYVLDANSDRVIDVPYGGLTSYTGKGLAFTLPGQYRVKTKSRTIHMA